MLGIIHRQIKRGILYVKKKLTDRQFLLFSCVVVGVSTSLAAIALKLFVFKLEELFFGGIHAGNVLWYQMLLPMLGIGISSLLIVKVFKGKFLKGNDKIVYAIAKEGSNLPRSQTYSHLLTSSVTVGLGGSAGLESPMVATGAAIGSTFGRIYYLSYKERTVLLACGIASGIASAFSAPIAGVLFALEVLMIDITINTFIPLIISAASGALLAKISLGNNILLSFNNMQAFNYNNTLFYIVLGLLAGVTALYYARAFTWIERKFAGMQSPVKKWLIGSALLAALIFFFPPLFGEGYSTIKILADTNKIDKLPILFPHLEKSWVLLLFLLALILFKVFATGFTLQGGGNGGSFAPALFIGGVLGFFAAQLFHLMGYQNAPTANFIIAGMAGMLSGLFFAPLTAIFLIAEITGGYGLIIPLMLVSAISFFVVKSFEPLSMEMKKLSEHSTLNPSDKDKFLLSRLELIRMIDKTYLYFLPTATIADLRSKMINDTKDAYAVIDEKQKLLGTLYLGDLKSIILDKDIKTDAVILSDVMTKTLPLSTKDTVESALYRFDQSEKQLLPVVNDENQWLGFITKSAILEEYRMEILRASFN